MEGFDFTCGQFVLLYAKTEKKIIKIVLRADYLYCLFALCFKPLIVWKF